MTTHLPDLVRGLHPGDVVDLFFGKYDGTAHWRYLIRYLGADDHGVWLGGRAGTHLARPGREFIWDGDFVVLIPPDRHHVLTVNAPTSLTHNEVYVDITTIPIWRVSDRAEAMAQVHAVDLDLDVVRGFGETTPLLEDEDEFAEHQVRFGYPKALVEAAQAEAVHVSAQIAANAEPFGSRAAQWLATVASGTE